MRNQDSKHLTLVCILRHHIIYLHKNVDVLTKSPNQQLSGGVVPVALMDGHHGYTWFAVTAKAYLDDTLS